MISWDVSDKDYAVIKTIADRAVSIAEASGVEYDVLDAQMDIAATHANGCPLDLKRLRDADDFNFSHDIFGIRRHLNRETGQLMHGFWPRLVARKNK